MIPALPFPIECTKGCHVKFFLFGRKGWIFSRLHGLSNPPMSWFMKPSRAPQAGEIISVKATIGVVRERGPHLRETDCQLVEMIVDVATKWGLFVAFDVREA